MQVVWNPSDVKDFVVNEEEKNNGMIDSYFECKVNIHDHRSRSLEIITSPWCVQSFRIDDNR